MSVQARNVKKGDWLDTRGAESCRCSNQGLHRVFLDAERLSSGGRTRADTAVYLLHREGTTMLREIGSAKVNVWRPIANLDDQRDPRPIDLRTDRPLTNLSEVHRAAELGVLASMFPIGSYWEVGPFVHGKDPQVVRVTGAPFSEGINYSCAPEDAEAKGKPTWFIETEMVLPAHKPTPRSGPKYTGKNGQPPHVLCALTPRMAEKAGLCSLTAPHPCAASEAERVKVRDLTAKLAVETSKRENAEGALLALQTRIDAALKSSKR